MSDDNKEGAGVPATDEQIREAYNRAQKHALDCGQGFSYACMQGFRAVLALSTPRAVMPAAPSDAGREYPPLPKPTSWQIAIIQDNEYGQNIIGWRDEFSETSFNFSYLPKRVMFTTEQMRAYVDADRAALTQPTTMQQAEPGDAKEREPDLYDEIECDLPYLFGRAAAEGHEASQRLAQAVREKMKLARKSS